MTATTIDIRRVQHIRKAILRVLIGACVLVSAVSQSLWAPGGSLHEALETLGLALIGIAVLGRCWATLYIGGRKNVELVQVGSYSLVRNPLYSFTFVAAAGIGLQLGGALFGLIALTIAVLVFWPVVLREERHLQQQFGGAYTIYMRQVPRFLPRARGWRGADAVQINPNLVVRTFFEACFFFLAAPTVELIEVIQQTGWLPVLLRLP